MPSQHSDRHDGGSGAPPAERRALRRRLMSAVRPDVCRLARRWGHLLPELARLRGRTSMGRSLLHLTQRTLDHLAAPAGKSGSGADVARSGPAVRLAALYRYTGSPGRDPGGMLGASALLCRDALRRAGIPFRVRRNAELLLRCGRMPFNLIGSEAPPGTYMDLACRLDTEALYSLERAALQACMPGLRGQEWNRLELFAATCRGLGVFGRAPEPTPGWTDLEARGLEGARLRRVANALRYFRIARRERDEKRLHERLEEQTAGPDGRLHLLVGPAACGKSTWAAENLSGTRIVSTDRMRKELTGDHEDQSRNYLVFKKCGEQLRSALEAGRAVTFDATNYCRDVRETPVSAARETGAEIWAYCFDVGLDDLLTRNRSRRRRVPPEVIHRHWRNLEPPALYEADVCHVVDRRGRVERYRPD